MTGVVINLPQRPRNLRLIVIISMVLVLAGLSLFTVLHDFNYIYYITLPGIIGLLYSLGAYRSSRRMREWVEESGAVWGYRGAFVSSVRLPITNLVVANSLLGFVILAIAWYLVRGSSDWLGLLVGLLIFAGIDAVINYTTLRVYIASKRSLAREISSILLYSDRLRIRTGTNEILDIPLNEAMICIAGLGWHDTFGNAFDTLRIRYADTTYTLTVPNGVGQEFINALKSIGVDEVHTCNYLGIK